MNQKSPFEGIMLPDYPNNSLDQYVYKRNGTKFWFKNQNRDGQVDEDNLVYSIVYWLARSPYSNLCKDYDLLKRAEEAELADQLGDMMHIIFYSMVNYDPLAIYMRNSESRCFMDEANLNRELFLDAYERVNELAQLFYIKDTPSNQENSGNELVINNRSMKKEHSKVVYDLRGDLLEWLHSKTDDTYNDFVRYRMHVNPVLRNWVSDFEEEENAQLSPSYQYFDGLYKHCRFSKETQENLKKNTVQSFRIYVAQSLGRYLENQKDYKYRNKHLGPVRLLIFSLFLFFGLIDNETLANTKDDVVKTDHIRYLLGYKSKNRK